MCFLCSHLCPVLPPENEGYCMWVSYILLLIRPKSRGCTIGSECHEHAVEHICSTREQRTAMVKSPQKRSLVGGGKQISSSGHWPLGREKRHSWVGEDGTGSGNSQGDGLSLKRFSPPDPMPSVGLESLMKFFSSLHQQNSWCRLKESYCGG